MMIIEDDDLDQFDDETRAIQDAEWDTDHFPREEEAYLIVLSGNRVGAMCKVKKGMTIGRSVQTDLQTPDEGVSRVHVRIEAVPEGLAAVDQGSRNGTYVNGERISTMVLKDGDKIRIGTTTILKFSYADKLEESFQQQMYNAALKDPLTHLYNRRHFNEHLLTEFAYATRHSFPLALVMMDLDFFKKINDRYGHLVGDSVLIGLAQTVINSIRKEDLFARYGGEEFALLCRGTTAEIAHSIADRIRRQVSTSSLVIDIPELKITVSGGAAGIPLDSIKSPEDLINAADKALYLAKSEGRNRICIYSEKK